MSSSEGDDYLEPHILEAYDVQELLGKGAYGVVWRVIDKETGNIFALKKIFKAFQNSTDSQRTYREVMLLRQLKHERIIGLEKIIKADNGEDLYLVFPFMDSDMHYAIRTGILEEDHKRFLVYQMLTAILYIHSAGVIHRDIKPENMLIDTSCSLMVADFGLARCYDENLDEEIFPMTDYVATRWYRAPEILFGSTVYTKAVDIWAVGCIVAELYGERPIFPGKSTIDQLARIMEITGRPTDEELGTASLGSPYISKMMGNIPRVITRSLASMYPQCDDDAIDFMEACFKFNPQDRPTVEECLAHPYLAEFREIDEEILAEKKVHIPIEDNVRQKTEDYKNALYKLCKDWDTPDEVLPQVMEKKRRKRKERKAKSKHNGTMKSSSDDKISKSGSKKNLKSSSKKNLHGKDNGRNSVKISKKKSSKRNVVGEVSGDEEKTKSRRGNKKMQRSKSTQKSSSKVKGSGSKSKIKRQSSSSNVHKKKRKGSSPAETPERKKRRKKGGEKGEKKKRKKRDGSRRD